MMEKYKSLLWAILLELRASKDLMTTLLADGISGMEIQDDELRDMYYDLNEFCIRLRRKIAVEEAGRNDNDGSV